MRTTYVYRLNNEFSPKLVGGTWIEKTSNEGVGEKSRKLVGLETIKFEQKA